MIRKVAPRPFTFGPIRFEGLDDPEFDMNAAYDAILSELERVVGDLCLHGNHVTVKGRTLKRSSTLVKHARFLNNLQVTPEFPQLQMEASMDALIEEENDE
jgi:hypothetical protein